MAGQERPSDKGPSVPKDQGIAILKSEVAKAEAMLKNRPITAGDRDAWKASALDALLKAVGRSSSFVRSFRTIDLALIEQDSFPEHRKAELRASYIERKLLLLQSAADALLEERSLQQPSVFCAEYEKAKCAATGSRVFLVHGRNERWNQETARFLEKIRVDLTVLREEPNRGLAVIEKLERHSEVDFAVVLLTGDDRGGLASKPCRSQKPRARQNVIFELGLFIGKLGRERVCALYEEGVEVPSDYSGVLFVPLDQAGGWKLELMKELKAANIPFDASLVV
jgi:predicted nucleotide-binding protein